MRPALVVKVRAVVAGQAEVCTLHVTDRKKGSMLQQSNQSNRRGMQVCMEA